MTKKELNAILEDYEDDEPVFVAIFFEGHAEISDIESVGRNGGLQLGVRSTMKGKP